MFNLEFFRTIARIANELWLGYFTAEEQEEYANELKYAYDESIEGGKASREMVSLLTNLCEDMDYMDYEDLEEREIDIATMERVIEEWYEHNK